MGRALMHWWYPLTASGLDQKTVVKEAARGAHLPLLVPPHARGLQPEQYVWFYSGRQRVNRPVAAGVIQVAYKGTDDKKWRVVVALYRAASVWLSENDVGLSTSRPGHAPRRAFQDVAPDDARRLMDSGVARFL